MVKSFTFIKKKAGLTREEFLRYWKEKHGPLAATVVPGLRKYIQCHPIPGFESEIDGIVELWWDNPESHRSFLNWRQSEEAKILREDEEKFIDISQMVRFLAEEHIIVDDQTKASV
jgi:uncharacterized protein (TIGR02118 family)